MRTDSKSRLILYVRQGCHLCEDMLSSLPDCVDLSSISLEIRDVDSNPDWTRDYGHKVPVLTDGKSIICHYFLDPVALDDFLHSQSPAL